MLLHDPFPSRNDETSPLSEVEMPQTSNIAGKGISSDVGVRNVDFGGQDVSGCGIFVGGIRVPSSFGGGFPSSFMVLSAPSFTIFGGGASAAAMRFSEKYAKLREEEQARILTTLDKPSR